MNSPSPCAGHRHPVSAGGWPRSGLSVLLGIWLGTVGGLARLPGPTPSDAVVVFNQSFPRSEEIARSYGRMRGIPPDRVIGITCSGEETITRTAFEEEIRKPLEKLFQDRGWIVRSPHLLGKPEMGRVFLKSESNEIRVLVLCRGIPLRIDHDPTVSDTKVPEAFRSNGASVDSELALLPSRGWPIMGGAPNPYFRSSVGFSFDDACMMMLVARLDGPDTDTVLLRVQEGLARERKGLQGRVMIDERGIKEGGYAVGDQWLVSAASQSRLAGMIVIEDQQEPLISHLPAGPAPALYAGWYAEQPGGVIADPAFRFLPGAVAYHIHSFSAITIRTNDRHWVGPLLAKGAAVTMGYVHEPYLQLTAHVDVFMRRLLGGSTFVEAAYAAHPWLSWMQTIVGDPFYRPFPPSAP